MEKNLFRAVCLWTILSLAPNALVYSANIFEIISTEQDLTEFYNLIQSSETIKLMLRYAEMTVFAPTNDAWRKYRGQAYKSNLLAYHIVKSSITTDRFPAALPSEALGGLPIWVNKQANNGFRYTYFANHGQIIRSDIKGQSVEGAEQVLHIIDEVLEPTIPQNEDPNFRNPSAYKVLANPSSYGIVEELSSFEQRVSQFRKVMIYQGGDGHTFFLPVNGNSNVETWNQVDDKVIDGHVIPDKVFFTKLFPHEPQETLSFNDNIRVVLSMKNESIVGERDYELTVQSNTLMGNQLYQKGTVVAKIVKANIPVKNGVVHLIENPLIIINKNLGELLQQNAQLREFSHVLQKYNVGLLDMIKSSEATVFAPSNEAFHNVDPSRLQLVYNDERRVKQMLELHVSRQRFTAEQIIQGTSVISTYDQTRKLHFRHSFHNITVVGGGVNATITTQDIGAINGIVHIIDKVMGIPYRTIYEKLDADASLSETFLLGKQQNYNEQFRTTDRVYTYFVPHNDAWVKLKMQFPSEYSKLFSGQYNYQVKKILNRHLIVSTEYSLQDLLRIGGPIQTVEGKFDFFESNGRNYIRWDGETSEILDADVETNNGRVHVIRDVLFKQRDMTTGQAPSAPFLSIFTILLTALVARFIV